MRATEEKEIYRYFGLSRARLERLARGKEYATDGAKIAEALIAKSRVPNVAGRKLNMTN